MMCIQSGEANIMTAGAIPIRRKVLWLNEVCRARYNLIHNTNMTQHSTSPVNDIMAIAEAYAVHKRKSHSLYLMVEKHPDHGNGEKLLQLYGPGYTVVAEDKEYWYMEKKLV